MQPGSRFAAWLKLAHKRPLTSRAFIMPSGYPCTASRIAARQDLGCSPA
ncbi:hypothetical protein SNOG_16532 [Parastagonospora nodorum SN15]|uniref:Uncharacterized protein n=1 Tax=Phaeosphaeria nodorum (strain SN15 / ATCC MYA-4574 / FGSC 10173) TaxID=321614 RepID=Q0TVD2_PHANO|nr:hypothetical protein SNOG_16532 [Parastagonospora nodorum SN15]EAT76072.1 hypothetical protein SNOG_16532 [Parastagonospora nodorum SN15]